MRRFVLIGSLLLLCSCTAQPVAETSQTSSGETALFESKSSSTALRPATGPVLSTVTTEGYLRVGKADAPLTLTIVTNHACDYCRTFQRTVMPRLQEDFMDTGWLAIETVIFPIRKYPMSVLFAKTLICGARQGTGSLLHNAMFDLSTHDAASLQSLIQGLHFDGDALRVCTEDQATEHLIATQTGMLLSRGITLVPTLMLQEEVRTGLPEYADLRGWIERAIRQE